MIFLRKELPIKIIYFKTHWWTFLNTKYFCPNHRIEESRERTASFTWRLSKYILISGLFQRVILQSGSALCPWALAKDAVSHARKLAQSMNCSTRDSMKLIDCLRKKRLEDIMSVDIQAPDHLSAFGPTIDGIVLPKSPMYLMQTKPDLFLRYDMMFGVTKVESYFGYSAMEEVGGIDGRKRDRVIRTLVRNLYNRHLQQVRLGLYFTQTKTYVHR